MTVVVSWNIQNGRGVDGALSLERIAAVIREMADADIVCLQEISNRLPLEGGGGAPDQSAELSELFPEHRMIFGPAIEADPGSSGRLWAFGNAVLSRLPILAIFRHPLPQPAEAGVRHMPRQAIEVTVATEHGPLRVVNTHLEYHSRRQRLAQIARLREIQIEIHRGLIAPAKADPDGPYQSLPRPIDGVMCGDFNLEPDSEEYRAILAPLGNRTECFQDAWRLVRQNRPHDPTCGLFDRRQWPQGAHCRDFFFVSGNVAQRVVAVEVDMRTDASDHQPLMLRTDRQSAESRSIRPPRGFS